MTIILIAVLISFTALKFIQLFQRLNPTVSRTTVLRPESQDGVGYFPRDQGFDLSFGLNQPLDPTIGYFTTRLIN